jgi:hypothetical protein
MKTARILSLLILSSFFLGSCIDFDNGISGNGNVITEYHEVSDFHGIEASSGLNVYVEFGEMSQEVEVIADENLHEYIEIEVNNGILEIESRRNIRRASSKDVFVKAGKIDEIDVSSAADFIGENVLITDDIEIDVSSAGDLDIELEATTLRVGVSSSGSADIKGKGDKIIANVSSAGDLNASEFVVEEGDVDASSAADARVHVTKKIRARASSAASVRYEGNPKERNTESSSAGNVSGN